MGYDWKDFKEDVAGGISFDWVADAFNEVTGKASKKRGLERARAETERGAAAGFAELDVGEEEFKELMEGAKANFTPYLEAGASGLERLRELILGPVDTSVSAIGRRRMDDARKALLMQAAATGGFGGGRTARMLAEQQGRIAEEDIVTNRARQLSELGSLTNLGQYGANAIGNIQGILAGNASSLASQRASLHMGKAEALAQNAVARGSLSGQLFSDALSAGATLAGAYMGMPSTGVKTAGAGSYASSFTPQMTQSIPRYNAMQMGLTYQPTL